MFFLCHFCSISANPVFCAGYQLYIFSSPLLRLLIVFTESFLDSFFLFSDIFFVCFFSNTPEKGSRWPKLSLLPASLRRLLPPRSAPLPRSSPLRPSAGHTSRIGLWPATTVSRPATSLHDAHLVLPLLPPRFPSLLLRSEEPQLLLFFAMLLNKIVFMPFLFLFAIQCLSYLEFLSSILILILLSFLEHFIFHILFLLILFVVGLNLLSLVSFLRHFLTGYL